MANSFMADIGSIYAPSGGANLKHNTNKTSPDLDMSDFLQLMVVQLQSQTIDNTADTSDMLNQMVQMQMVTALTNMTDASVMSYAGSLVGKEVTIGDYSSGQLEEKVIEVMGSGLSNGEQVIFAKDGSMYKLSSIMAVGRLPKSEADGGEGFDETGGTTGSGGVTGSGGTTGSGGVSGSGETGGADSGSEETGGAGSAGETGGAGTAQQPDGGNTGAAEEIVDKPADSQDPVEEDPTDIVDPTQAAEQGE